MSTPERNRTSDLRFTKPFSPNLLTRWKEGRKPCNAFCLSAFDCCDELNRDAAKCAEMNVGYPQKSPHLECYEGRAVVLWWEPVGEALAGGFAGLQPAEVRQC